MPRVRRKLSETGIYHVMLRGNERRKIFLNNADREKFIEVLAEKGRDNAFLILAYCLMDNHIHLLIKEENDQISKVMKRIGVSYAYYFNKKYERTGHLFQDRFKSAPVNDERYLLAVARYIHNNPVKAMMVKEPGQYPWSSYNAYINKDKAYSGLINRDFILKIFSDDEEKSIKHFIEFSMEQSDEEFMDIEEGVETGKKIKNETEALKYIESYLKKRRSCTVELLKNKDLRNEIICYLKDNSTLSVREIATILGINRNIVQRTQRIQRIQ